MRRALLVWLLVLGGIVGLIFLKASRTTETVSAPTTDTAVISNAAARPRATTALPANLSNPVPPEKVLPSAVTTTIAKAGQPNTPEVTDLTPLTILENARTAIRNYGQRFGGNPVGNNAEITRALMGGNPGQIQFISADAGLRVNGEGELIDAWGVPFFFHQLSGEQTEIHSAGPDKIMWTEDDLVTH